MLKMFVRGVSLLLLVMPTTVYAQTADRWSGAYVGLQAGGVSGDFSNSPVAPASASDDMLAAFGSFFGQPEASIDDSSGFIGGALVGYNWRAAGFVIGVEADLSGTTPEESSSQTTGQFDRYTTKLDHELNWLATIRGRIGFLPIEPLLLYGTGGVAFGGVDTTLSYSIAPSALQTSTASFGSSTIQCVAERSCFSASDEDTLTGWTIGGGFEYALNGTISLKGEYLYVNLGSHNVTARGTDPETTPDNSLGTRVETELHIGRVGLNIALD